MKDASTHSNSTSCERPLRVLPHSAELWECARVLASLFGNGATLAMSPKTRLNAHYLSGCPASRFAIR